jgi:hypothetical protein
MAGGLRFLDGDDGEVELDADEAESLLALTGRLEDATVSACRYCASRVLATFALVELLDRSGPHPRGTELVELADDAPTLHLYVVDERDDCAHRGWLDPGHAEWVEVLDERD